MWQKMREHMITRLNVCDKNFLITNRLETITVGSHTPRSLLKGHSFPSSFSSRKPVFSKSSLQHTTRDVARPADALHSSSSCVGPPPSFPSRCSSSTPYAQRLPHKDGVFTIEELTNRENTLSSHIPSTQAHASPSSAYTLGTRSKTERSDASNVARCLAQEPFVVNSVEDSEELFVNCEALP